jgi:hypothetical protein
VVAAWGWAGGLAAQATPPPADAFRDPAARALVLRAREARTRDADGIESYEALLRERIYVGLAAVRFRRERGLFVQERVARIRWTEGGERVVQWVGARRAVPVLGADTRLVAEGEGRDDEPARAGGGDREEERRGGAAEDPEEEPAAEGEPDDVAQELRRDLPAELLAEADLPSFVFRPGAGERLAFGEEWALHPLADTALAHYRYRSGDTLRLGLPGGDLVLVEVRVEPRRADFRLVAASLWFEAGTAALVRATYKPARAFRLDLDAPEDAGDVPGFLRPIEAEIRFITMEYSLHDGRYWLPRRFALEGEGRVAGAIRMPLTVQWSLGEYEVNEATRLAATGPLPPGWSRASGTMDEPGDSARPVTLIVPDPDSLLTSPELSERVGPGGPAGFTPDEVRTLRDELEQLLPRAGVGRPRIAWGLQRNLLRYNRVEGLSAGVHGELPLAPRATLSATARMGTGNREPYGTLALRLGPTEAVWEVEGYHRLTSMNDWEDPFTLAASLGNLALGNDRGEYYEASGATLSYRSPGRSRTLRLEVFAERQRPVALTTSFALAHQLGLGDDSIPSVRQADPVEVVGVRARLEGQRGLDPGGLVLTWELRGEVGRSGAEYQRMSGRFSVAHPLPGGLAGAVEVESGVAWGPELPSQRRYFLGGPRRLRGLFMNELAGESFWRSRTEVANDFPGARLVLFGDVGWIGRREEFGSRAFRGEELVVAGGVGVALLDGLIRLDAARALQGASRWQVNVYLDGLL